MHDRSFEISQIYLKVGKENNFGITEMMLQTWLAGVRFSLIGKADSAKAYYQKALSFPDLNPNIEAMKYRVVTWLGYLHHSEGDLDTAVFYMQKSFDFYQKKGFLYMAMCASNDLGYFYFKNNEINIAEKY